MKHTIIALAAAATLAAALPSSAQARCHGCGVAAGVVGGLAAGAIIGGAYPYYPGYVGYPAPVSYPGPGYYPAPTYPPPGCVIRQRPVTNGYGWSMRKIRVCY